jgi:diacylglycerol kinase (ATP)
MGLVPLALWLPVSPIERLLLIASLLLVLIVEILNSAVEAAVDRIGLEHHELSGRAKDLGSAAVLLSLMLTALTWGTVLWTWWVRG